MCCDWWYCCIYFFYSKVTKEELSKHFAPAGQITDINLKFKKNGSFRRFAFIGFESEEAANEALKFNNTYIKTSKIIVDQCLDLGKYFFYLYPYLYLYCIIYLFIIYCICIIVFGYFRYFYNLIYKICFHCYFLIS